MDKERITNGLFWIVLVLVVTFWTYGACERNQDQDPPKIKYIPSKEKPVGPKHTVESTMIP